MGEYYTHRLNSQYTITQKGKFFKIAKDAEPSNQPDPSAGPVLQSTPSVRAGLLQALFVNLPAYTRGKRSAILHHQTPSAAACRCTRRCICNTSWSGYQDVSRVRRPISILQDHHRRRTGVGRLQPVGRSMLWTFRDRLRESLDENKAMDSGNSAPSCLQSSSTFRVPWCGAVTGCFFDPNAQKSFHGPTESI